MDITVHNWKPRHDYYKHDIVRVGDLTGVINDRKYYITINGARELLIGKKFKIRGDVGYSTSMYVKKATVESTIKDPRSTHLRIKKQTTSVYDSEASNGVAFGIHFFDKNDKILSPKDGRKVARLIGSSELDYTEYYKAYVQTEPEYIPDGASYAQLFIGVYGLKAGGFEFQGGEVKNINEFFYSLSDHNSTEIINKESGEYKHLSPNEDNGSLWTQDFFWQASYGAKVDVNANNDYLQMSEGNDYVSPASINSLPLKLSLKFENRTDREAKAIVHFLQEKSFAYKSIYGIDYKGERLSSSEIGNFSFKFTHPYKNNLMYNCVNFSHNIKYRNNNDVVASFECNTESILDSVEGSSGYNPRTDVLIPITINGTKTFYKDRETRLDTFVVNESETGYSSNDVESLSKYFSGSYLGTDKSFLGRMDVVSERLVDEPLQDNLDGLEAFTVTDEQTVATDIISDDFSASPGYTGGTTDQSELIEDFKPVTDDEKNFYTDDQWWQLFIDIKFNKPQTYEEDDYIYINVNSVENSIFSVGLVRIMEKISETEYRTYPIDYNSQADLSDIIVQNNGYDGTRPDVSLDPIGRHPDDCLASKIILPEGVSNIPHVVYDETIGEFRKRKIITKDYRVFYLERTIEPGDIHIYVSADKEHTVDGPVDTHILISQVLGKSSIYIRDPDTVMEYPWFKMRDLDYRANFVFTVPSTPNHLATEFTKYYKKKYKKSINQNLSTINVVFEQRTDEEAKAILLFLESHLGYRKFSFEVPRPYDPGDDNTIPQDIVGSHAFYCPSWSHTVVYKNNHTISATFIESKTADIYDDSHNQCVVGASIYDPISFHSIEKFKPVLVTYPKGGLEDTTLDGGKKVIKREQIDLVYLIKYSPAMNNPLGYQNFSVLDGVIDTLKKICISYDDYVCPGTNSYGVFNTPGYSKNADPSKSTPPLLFTDSDDGSMNVGGRLQSEIEKLTLQFTQTFGSTDFEFNDFLKNEKNYDLNNLGRFSIKLNQRELNIGIVFGTREFPLRAADLSLVPGGFDPIAMVNGTNLRDPLTGKIAGYGKVGVQGIDEIRNFVSDGGTSGSSTFGGALAMLYNSSRAKNISKRILVHISDGKYNDGNAWEQIVDQLKPGGELSVRRPTDTVLNGYKLDIHMGVYSANEDTGQHNPDKSLAGGENPDWYDEFVPTFVMNYGVGNSINSSMKTKCFDYSQNPDNPEFYVKATDQSNPETNLDGMLSMFTATEKITYNTGFDHAFSITVHNCGPQDLELKNVLVNSDQQGGTPKHVLEFLKSGIIRNGNIYDIQYTPGESSESNPLLGLGGQFSGDINNTKILSNTRGPSDVLWQSFNTKYEVFRNGKIDKIDGGWGEKDGKIRTAGVDNIGVAKSGMPIRVYKLESGLDLIDYNIGNAGTSDCSGRGDYSHLPVLTSGDSLDLFFGLRASPKFEKYDNIQIIVNAESSDPTRPVSCQSDVKVNIEADSEFDFSRTNSYGVNFDADWIVFTYEFTDGRDMDTRTRVIDPPMGDGLGWCRGSSYGWLQWGGDNLGVGVEGTLLNINSFKSAYPSKSQIKMRFNCWWYGSRGRNPLAIYAALYRGGVPVKSGYGWYVRDPEAEVWVRSLEKVVTMGTGGCRGGDYVADFTYDVRNLNGIFSYV